MANAGLPRTVRPGGHASGGDATMFQRWWPLLVVISFVMGVMTTELELFGSSGGVAVASEGAEAEIASAAGPPAETYIAHFAEGEATPDAGAAAVEAAEEGAADEAEEEAAPEGAEEEPEAPAVIAAPSTSRAELGYTGNPIPFTKENIRERAKLILPRFEKVSKEVPYHQYGVLFSEGLALMSAASLAEVDILFESGTAGGQSAEFMARFFEGTDVKLYTIDSDANKYEKRGGLLSSTAERLKKFPMITPLRADSFKKFPELVEEHKGKRIGVFVDGPKRFPAMQLCLKTMRSSNDVKFCAIHDVAPMFSHDITKEMEAWKRNVLMTHQPYWRKAYGYLDNNIPKKAVPKEMIKEVAKLGYGLGVLAGMETMPDGVKGDKFKPIQ